MIRAFTVVCVLILLGGCSSGGTSPVFSAIKGLVFSSDDEDSGTASGGGGLTREKIAASGLALIRAQLVGEEVTNILTATSLNGGYVTYVSAFQQTITTKGNLITATRGLGGDLISVVDFAGDPVTNFTPPANWPSQVRRDYHFPGDGPAGVVISITCDIARGQDSQITIVEVTYDVTRMTESCATDEGTQFDNVYLVDKDGLVWEALQWTGPARGFINIEVLEPLT